MARASFITASFSVMALAVVCSAALLPCSSTNTVMTCYTNQDCDWRSDTQTCAPSCAFSYPTLVDCLRDTHCEWNPYVSRCQQRCSSHPTESDCLAPTCTWFQNATNATNGSLAFTTTLAGRNASYCGSTCGRYGDPGNCTADPNCQWDPTAQVMCVASNGTSLARDFMILELLNSELVSILIHNPSALASFALAIQRDLTEAYNGATITVNGATDVELSLILSLVTVEYASTVSTIPPVIDGQLGKPATWLKSTASLFTQLGGTTALVVGSVTPANGVAPSTTQAPPQAPFTPGPVTAPQGEASNFSTTYIVIAIVCTAVVILAAVGVLVFRWRHNPYAAARTLAVQRFTPAEFDRLKQLNEHVITYQDAVALKKQLQVPMLDRDEDSCTPELQWPVVAHASMPGKDHRNFALRPLLNEMRLELFPVVFEHLTQIRIAMDEQDRIRVNPHRVDPIDVIRYNGAFRLQIGRTSADFVLLGAARFVVVLMNDDGSCRPYDSVQVLRPDAPDSCNVVKDLFETSNYCSHVGVIDQRKVVVSRLAPPDEFAISTTIDNPTDQRDIQLLGVPASWTAVVVEAAIKVMIKVGCEHLVDGAATSWGSVYVRAEPATHAGNWRIRVYPPQSLGVLIAAAPRFWGMDNDVLCCQCTSGIGISHRVGFETMAAPVQTTMAPPVPPPRGLMRHPNTPHDNQDVEMLLR